MAVFLGVGLRWFGGWFCAIFLFSVGRGRYTYEYCLIYTTRWSLGGGFKYFLFSPLFGEDSHFD